MGAPGTVVAPIGVSGGALRRGTALTIEDVHEAACDAEVAGRLRDILLRASAAIEALYDFRTGWPVPGWDRATTLATLRDLTPTP